MQMAPSNMEQENHGSDSQIPTLDGLIASLSSGKYLGGPNVSRKALIHPYIIQGK